MTPKHAALWLRLMGWGFILFGIVFVTLAFPKFDDLAHAITAFFDWSGQASKEELTRNARWFGAIMSGLSAGFGAFYVFLVAPLLTIQNLSVNQIAKRGGLIAAFIWYIVDNAGSLGAGVPSNVATNSLFLAAYVLPLLLVKFEKG